MKSVCIVIATYNAQRTLERCLASIFEQTLYEAALAKFASRMLSLDRAADNVGQRLTRVELLGKRIEHLENGRKQLNTFSGINLWHR